MVPERSCTDVSERTEVVVGRIAPFSFHSVRHEVPACVSENTDVDAFGLSARLVTPLGDEDAIVHGARTDVVQVQDETS